GSSLARLAHARQHLVAAERFGGTGALDDREGGCLDGAEPAPALRALTAPADDGAVLLDPAVDHPGVRMTAEGTVHRRPPRWSGWVVPVGEWGDFLWMTCGSRHPCCAQHVEEPQRCNY